MTTRTTQARALGIALLAASGLACRSGTTTAPDHVAPAEPVGRVAREAAWTPEEAAERVHLLSTELSEGTATFEDVLDFAVEALAGIDVGYREGGVDGSVTRIIRAKEGRYLGRLRVHPVTAVGVLPIQLSFDTADHPEITRRDPLSRAKLEIAFGLRAFALEYCDARSESGYRSSLSLLQSITEEKPLPLGGNLLVDRTGACTWQGTVLRFKKDPGNAPPWQEQETELQRRARAALDSARAAELRQRIDSLGQR
jgi:hypothetical protein